MGHIRREALKVFLVVGHIPFEIVLQISYLLTLQIQDMGIFQKTYDFSLINGCFFFRNSAKN